MAEAGCQIDFELTNLAVVGFVEVLPKLREFFRVADIGSDIFAKERPDAVVLVDFPGFNWHIARRAKEHQIPVFYYLPPQLWAWGSWRVRKMKRDVDHVFCNLPFESEWYGKHDVPVDYVGHPFFDEVANRQLDVEFMQQWSSDGAPQVAVLPGSRGREVKNIWPMQLEAIRELAKRYPKTRFLVAALKEEHRTWCESLLNSGDDQIDIHFFVNRTSEVIELADCSLMKSGSVSLEMMARGTPSVVVYHVGKAFYTIGRRLTNLNSMTLPNLIAKKTIMPEFLAVGNSKSETIEKAIAAVGRLLGDRDERIRQRLELLQLSRQYGQTGASDRTAKLFFERLGRTISAGESRSVRQRAAA